MASISDGNNTLHTIGTIIIPAIAHPKAIVFPGTLSLMPYIMFSIIQINRTVYEKVDKILN